MSACIASIEFLVSAWAAPIRSKSRSTAEPGRERRDEEVDLFDTLEERPDLVSILCFIIIQEFQSVTNRTRSSNDNSNCTINSVLNPILKLPLFADLE